MKKALSIIVVLASFLYLPTASAQPSGCEGPPELCQQVLDLNKKLAEQQAVSEKYAMEADKKASLATTDERKKNEERTAKIIAGAAVLAVILKGLLSMLRSWKSYFKTEKGKAWVRVITILVGAGAFVAANVGMGLPWWQALILAGGGPGAIWFHEMTDLVLYLLGKKKSPPPDPDQGQGESPPEPQA